MKGGGGKMHNDDGSGCNNGDSGGEMTVAKEITG